MDITNDGLISGINSFDKRIQFWHSLSQKYKKIFDFNDDDAAPNVNDDVFGVYEAMPFPEYIVGPPQFWIGHPPPPPPPPYVAHGEYEMYFDGFK